MKAYKVFEPGWKCKDHVYEMGKTYVHEGKIEMCESGFHACTEILDCYKYYDCVPWNPIAEVEIKGKIQGPKDGCSKIVGRKITLIREISFEEMVKLAETLIKDGIARSDGSSGSDGVNGSHGVNRSNGVN